MNRRGWFLMAGCCCTGWPAGSHDFVGADQPVMVPEYLDLDREIRPQSHDWDRRSPTPPCPPPFHDLRHAHATHMLASGVNAKIASERLRHSHRSAFCLDLCSH